MKQPKKSMRALARAAAEEKEQKKQGKAADFEIDDTENEVVLNIKITAINTSLGEVGGNGLELFTLERKGIDKHELLRLAEEIENIIELVDLPGATFN